MTFARESEVPIERSRQEIEKILERYGASHFGYGTMPGSAVVMFEASNRRIKFALPLNPPPNLTEKQHAQFLRTRWRCLCLAIKAKLECVESGISTFEREFLANIVLPNGKTVGDHAQPFIEQAYSAKKMPPMLGFGGG
jgi:hypothetical protein